MNNLDKRAAQTAQKIVAQTLESKSSEVDNLATKALGVLQAQGVYAATLFLYSRTGKADKAIAPVIRGELLNLVPPLAPGATAPADEAQAALSFVTEHIAGDLDTLLLVKQVWEQTLIYVRYGAKARG
ncbi:MAG: hypothetical protein DRI37_02045 [Chloroflexi bacterium]|nr:MAG: hypothetical protein DRI37_02045 [Chloroflexota bacterium]